MTSSMLRRQLKNLVQNYSEAEVKVREATSNDPWGPSSSQMADISDLTYNAVACNEIMTMLWKRLKDDKNWRHIHKSLTLLEYLLKTGDDRVMLKMKENIYIVKALTEYRFVEKDGKDQGVNVREKAKVVLVLMEDDEKLKAERDFAVKTREKTSKGSAASSTDNFKDPNYKPVYVPGASGLPCIDNIPSVADLTASFAARKEERLRQEQEKKEAERRAKMSEDELKWEDAGKNDNAKIDAWSGEKEEEEEKSDAWGAPKEPSTDPWGAPAKTEDPFVADKTDEDLFTAPVDKPDTFISSNGDAFVPPKDDPFIAPKEDPFNAPKDDPFSAPKDNPFNAPKDDPFNAPKDDPFSAPRDDPFSAPKDDPFSAPKDDPFSAPKDDPFSAPKDEPFSAPKDDPFSAPKDDPFNTPKDDPFSAPKDDPFSASKDDPFIAPKENPLNAPKGDPFSSPKDDPFKAPEGDPFGAPKNDPFSAPKDDQFSASKQSQQKDPSNAPQDDPFGSPKNDSFEASKDDPFTTPDGDPFGVPVNDLFTAPVSAPPKEEPFAESTISKADSFTGPTTPPKATFPSPTKPAQNDLFATPSTPTKEDTFSTSQAGKEDPFAVSSAPSKEDPFVVPCSPPTEAALDPFSSPTLASPQETADTWGAQASSPPAKGSDAWGAQSLPKETKSGDPWGDGPGVSSPIDDSDPFRDASKPDDDPWGAPASAPVTSDDAWGMPAAPSDSSPSGDPFGDGAAKNNDPWGAPSNVSGNGAGKQTTKEEEFRRKTASFLGSTGGSLVDLDDLFAPNPKMKKQPLINTPAARTQAIGTVKGMTPGPLARSGAVAETLAPNYNPFISSLSDGVIHSASGAASPYDETLQFKEPLHALGMPHSSVHILHAAQDAPMSGMAPLVTQRGVEMLESGYSVGNILGTEDIPSRFFGANSADLNPFLSVSPQTEGEYLIGSGANEMINNNTNPFLF